MLCVLKIKRWQPLYENVARCCLLRLASLFARLSANVRE
jgi:hypothetical protein